MLGRADSCVGPLVMEYHFLELLWTSAWRAAKKDYYIKQSIDLPHWFHYVDDTSMIWW
jgi:hypothetical protein